MVSVLVARPRIAQDQSIIDASADSINLSLVIDLADIFFFQAEDGIRDSSVTGVQTCALPILIAPPEQPAPPVVAPPVQPALARVVQATDGLWFLVEESNAWILMPDPISDEDLASITLGDALHGELTVAQPGPARVIRSSDGTLYVVQG